MKIDAVTRSGNTTCVLSVNVVGQSCSKESNETESLSRLHAFYVFLVEAEKYAEDIEA